MLTREEILKEVMNCSPDWVMDDNFHDLFGKYGMCVTGVCDYWHWFTEENITDYAREHGHRPITDASTEELLQIWAITDHYWLEQYRKWLKRSEEKSSKLDRFIGHCEREYFGYDEDGYTLKTVDRVLDGVKDILNTFFSRKGKKEKGFGDPLTLR